MVVVGIYCHLNAANYHLYTAVRWLAGVQYKDKITKDKRPSLFVPLGSLQG